jgi:hypothetical protein
MCERRVVRAILGLALALTPAGVVAQRPATAAELEQEIARLTPIYLEAQRGAVTTDAARASRRAAPVEQVELTVGPLRIVTTSAEVELATRLFREEWQRYDAITRGRTAPLDRHTFVFHQGPDIRLTTRGQARDVKGGRLESEDAMRGRVRAAIGSAVNELLPRINIYSLLTSYPLGVGPSASTVYRELAAAPTALGQACFAGDLDACWRGLGQMDGSAPLLDIWFTPEERRSFAWRNREADNPFYDGVRARCLAGGDGACRSAVMSRLDRAQPFLQAARASLLWAALERGGEGALDRFWRSWDPQNRPPEEVAAAAMERMREYRGADIYDAPTVPAFVLLAEWTNVRAHLAAASGMDPDQLRREWLDEVRAARPEAPTPDRGDRTTTLLWIALLATFAASSTRWRLV